MNLLALDLGTKTGWATRLDGNCEAGTWLLATPRSVRDARASRMDRRLDPRICVFWDQLHKTHFNHRLDWVFFEDVQFAVTTMQCQLWSSLRATVWLFAYHHGIRVECCPVGTLKKFATGHGGATKENMAAALSKKLAGIGKLDDNAVDALHLLNWGEQTVARA